MSVHKYIKCTISALGYECFKRMRAVFIYFSDSSIIRQVNGVCMSLCHDRQVTGDISGQQPRTLLNLSVIRCILCVFLFHTKYNNALIFVN